MLNNNCKRISITSAILFFPAPSDNVKWLPQSAPAPDAVRSSLNPAIDQQHPNASHPDTLLANSSTLSKRICSSEVPKSAGPRSRVGVGLSQRSGETPCPTHSSNGISGVDAVTTNRLIRFHRSERRVHRPLKLGRYGLRGRQGLRTVPCKRC